MLWLIKADLASTRKPNPRHGAPSLLFNCGTLNAFRREASHFGLQIVAHEIKFVNTVLIGRMERRLCTGQGEEQPAMTRVHGFEREHIAKEGPIRLGIFAIDNDVSSKNHLPSGKMVNSFGFSD
jgi:hypothetical protein